MELIPTHRRGIDVTWNCNIHCNFCYHKYKPQKHDLLLEDIKNSILSAKAAGNNYVDLVGPGEPSMHLSIVEIIKYIKQQDMRVCLNTNAIISERKLTDILEAGIDDFLISFHGLEKTHDTTVDLEGARKVQEKSIKCILSYGKTFRTNTVINNQNYFELPELASYLSNLPARIVNFINFNPHGEWSGNENSLNFVTNLRIVEPLLNDAIDILEKYGIGVNVRYYPMCRIREDLRKNVCNDLQVMFDPYEWDYSITPKTIATYKSHGETISNTIESKVGVCASCGIKRICGGINKQYDIFTNYTQTDNIICNNEDLSDIFYYRKNNGKVFEII